MSRIRRKGLRKEPTGGWPLDKVLVGLATLRATRELFRQGWDGAAVRPWDVALWCGVSPQGATNALERLHQIGLLAKLPPGSWWGGPRYRLEREHPLYDGLSSLFADERDVAAAYERIRRSREEARRAAGNRARAS